MRSEDGSPSSPTPTPVRRPTSSLAAFSYHDVPASRGIAGRWSGDTAANIAIAFGLAVTLAAAFVGVLGSLRGAHQSGRLLFLTAFVIISGLAALAVITGAYALNSHRRIGSGGRGRATTGI